jgi:formylmethanofuran dehydrogenase subunit C
MDRSVEVVRRIADAPATASRKRFRGYKRESEKLSRRPEVRESETLRQLIAAWDDCRSVSNAHNDNKNMEKATRGLNYTANEIEKFCLLLIDYQHEWNFSSYAGRFLSALISNGKDRDYVIPTGHLDVKLSRLGMDNRKNIRVEGDLGDAVAWNMERGSITINGSVDSGLGAGMKGGRIIVFGNVGEGLGHEMTGGRITIEGNADREIGKRMHGGIINVKGNAGNASGSLMYGGRIIVDGNAGSYIGAGMKGGEIRVIGNADYNVGNEMHGGEIHVEGDIDYIGRQWSHIQGGRRIFHKGVLIFDG